MNEHPDAPTHGRWHTDPETGQQIHIDSHSPLEQKTIDALLLISRAFTVPSTSIKRGVTDARTGTARSPKGMRPAR